MIALILQRIEGFILDLPATASGSHHPVNRARMQPQVGDPGPALHLTLAVGLLVEQIVDPDLNGAVAQAEIIRPSKVMLHPVSIGLTLFFNLPTRACRQIVVPNSR